eukprot:CAMPEP_0174754728 /NCGR_PEP_ID=MMETSP1094-20130205/105881_1 /TAXON_ID=156173 /ORGANISM="Chrysochromulina brevifilum, Strain UTEX LB 985" /LENGTH=659 /DNA_ID=CAMNT_0015960607 /DNA_START=52 /DNA_END=2031 /DNA_ORIENTATION=+
MRGITVITVLSSVDAALLGRVRGLFRRNRGSSTIASATVVRTSPIGTPFPVGPDGPTWSGPTGTSFLPEDTVARASAGNPIEKAKIAKDASTAFNSIYEFAAAVRAGTMDWKDVEKADMNTRLKWVGLVHRDKRTPGRFMMRLRLPNGITNADSFRFYADSVEPYGSELGVIDITTRQNIQLRGVELQDADKIIDGLHARGQTSFHSALDNVRNMVGSPLAGIDDQEQVDTRPFTEALNDVITLNKETGERGNPVWCNLPRKFNIAVSGSRDDYAHTHINDIGFQPCTHATTGKMGFNIVLGGYMSVKRVAESVDMNLWIPADVPCAVDLTTAILRIFRDEGDRGDRQKARLMWLVESYGEVTEVDGHLRCHQSYREAVVSEMKSYGNGMEKMVDMQQPRPTDSYTRRGYLGVHSQPQAGLSRVGIHVPVGRMSVEETRQIADLADKYCPNGEIRLTVEQNVILPNVKDEDLAALLAEPCLHGDSRLRTNPGHIVGNLVSCTGAQFCGLAIIETKNNAESIAKKVEECCEVDRSVRIHWTGCPNSCGQVQAADIGLMGGPAKKIIDGKAKAVPGVKMFIGGTIGEHGKLQLDADTEGIPIEDLTPFLVQAIVRDFGGRIRPEYAEQYAAWETEQANKKVADEAAAAAKEAKKAAAKAAA